MQHLLVFVLIVALTSVFAGAIGSLLGLGGGVVMVPVLTLFLHIPFESAVGASIISVIATSSGSAAAYVRDRMTNLRVGMFLEIATTIGAISGAFLAIVLHGNLLYIIFSLVLLYSLFPMVRQILLQHQLIGGGATSVAVAAVPDRMATTLSLSDEFYDPASK